MKPSAAIRSKSSDSESELSKTKASVARTEAMIAPTLLFLCGLYVHEGHPVLAVHRDFILHRVTGRRHGLDRHLPLDFHSSIIRRTGPGPSIAAKRSFGRLVSSLAVKGIVGI